MTVTILIGSSYTVEGRPNCGGAGNNGINVNVAGGVSYGG